MINRIHKIINIKYSRIFKFIFLIRYLFLIFFTATALFLLIPKFFDYKKREAIIFQYIQKNYGLEVKNHDQMKYYSFPIPHIEINNVVSNFYPEDINLSSRKLLIYPELISIYNYEDFKVKKIKLNQIKIITEFKDIFGLYKKVFKIEKKIALENLSIQLNNLGKPIIHLKDIKYSNFGYNRYKLSGKIFERNFQIKFRKNFQNVDLEINDIGIFISLNFLEKENSPEKLIGSIKGKILKSNFKSDFTYNYDFINIENLFFRDKNLSLDGTGIVYFNPYFKIDFSSSIKNINTKLIKKLKLNEFLYTKNIIRKINFKNNLIFKPNKFDLNLLENLNLETNLNYGRLVFKKQFTIATSIFSCNGDTNLLDEFPNINFYCTIKSKDKKKLLKKFKINYKNNKEPLELKIIGNLNILNNKINFSSVKMNKNYSASNEDLKYFKKIFENIVFDQDFINIFSILKIRKLILEII